MSEHTHTEQRAWSRARDLKEAYWKAQGAHDRADVMAELDLLQRGEHPDFLGIRVRVNMDKVPTCDSAYRPHDGAYMKIFNRVATRDVGIFFRRKGLDVTVTRDEAPKHDPAVVKEIMTAIQQLADRLTPLEQGTFRAASQGPGIQAPREMSPQEAYQAHLTTRQLAQARASQRIANKAFPDKFPAHPSDVKDDAEEQRQATGDARHPSHAIAKKRLTFFDRKTIDANAKQNSAATAMRRHETDLAAERAKQISQMYGE
jgi:hypothetical protein